MNAGLSQNLILFILMGIGFIAGKMGILSAAVNRGLSRFILDFTLPAVIVTSMQVPFSPELRNLALGTLGVSAAVYALSFALAYALVALYRKAPMPEKGVHRFAMCFSNVGFMGFPVAEAILGRESLFMVSIYNIPFQLLAFSVGILMIAGVKRDKGAQPAGDGSQSEARPGPGTARSLINPAVLSALVGFALFLFSVRLPGPLMSALTILGETTTPLAMALIGATLASSSIKPILGNRRIWLTSLYRLAVHPLLVLGLGRLLGLSGLGLAVPVLIAAMPVAANTTILAGVYGGDAVSSGGLVFLSTVLSLGSIPLIMALL